MKTLKILLIVSISTLLTNHGFAQVTGSLVFDLSDIKLDTIGIYTQPSFPGCHYNDIVGAPNLPVIYKNYVLPKNAEITAVTISDSSKNILPET